MSRSPVLRYLAAVVLAVLAQAVRLPLHPPTIMPFITFVPFILVAAALGGFGPGVLVTALCTSESIYFALAPTRTLRIADPQGWAGATALALTGLVASALFERLRLSEQRQRAAHLELATIQGYAPIMMLVVDDALRARKANPLAVQFAGRDVSEVLGLGPGGAIGCLNALADPRGCGYSPDCAGCAIRKSIIDTLRNHLPHFGVEAQVPISIDGRREPRWLVISTVPMQLEEKGRTALVYAQDITAHKLAEAEILAQRDTLRRQARLIDLAHDAIIQMDPNRIITGWNTGAQEMYGWTEAEARSQVAHVLLQTDALQSNAEIDQILHQAGRWDGELAHTRRDGTHVVVDSRQVLLRDSARQPAGILEINRDITESKRAEADLREAHRRTSDILENVSYGFHVLDHQWRYVHVNSAAARMLRMSREELLGKNLWELWPRLTESSLGDAFRRALAENVRAEAEGFYPEPLNAWFEIRCYPSHDGLSVFLNDITGRKHAEEEIHRLNAELEERVRERTSQLQAVNKELEAFAYTVSHDLRAPLRGIDGWSLALEEECGAQLDSDGRRYVQRVRTEAQRMGHLIDDLLELSRVTRAPLHRHRVDLTALAHLVTAALAEAQTDRAVEFVIQPNLEAQGDASLLEVALTNLLGNAFKFTGRRADARIEFGRAEISGDSAFYVRDNGAGFDAAHACSLFQAFKRLHSASEFPGTGIGLATVKRIIQRHGGRVWAESRLGQGATFYFTLDVPPSITHRPSPASPSAPTATRCTVSE